VLLERVQGQHMPTTTEDQFEIDPNRRVLIVDDNQAIHDDFAKILGPNQADHAELNDLHKELFGESRTETGELFELDSAFQGQEALELVKTARLEERPYGIAFIDVRMPPGIDGVETTARLLEEDPEIGIVICSAYSDHSWEDMAEAFGNTDRVLILKKPFDTIEVRQLAHALQRRWFLARVAALKFGDLTELVEKQTRELQVANEKLKAEAAVRGQMLKELRESHKKIRELAYHDGLTGLPNRRLFNMYLDKTLARARRDKNQFAVIFVDFDNFKLINDTVGHQAADKVLRELAGSLNELIRSADLLALYSTKNDYSDDVPDSVLSRLGGDEFVILLLNTMDRYAPGVVAKRILDQLNKPVRIDEREVFVTASIGIATFPEDGGSGEILMRNADTAMYHAKQKGKAAYQYYSEAMNVASVERITLQSGLRRALEHKQLQLHYQPQIDVKSGGIIGAEALLRWEHPERGFVSPATFIPLAEETGLILPIGEWVFKEACSQLVAWQREGLPEIPVSINVSGVQFSRQDVCRVAQKALDETGLKPSMLGIEITETAMMSVRDRAAELLTGLRKIGISLSLDDFGTGYSSLSYLKNFPINVLKIDRTFVKEILSDRSTASITEAIISMAHILNLRVVAEGVEEQAQVELLERLGCDALQGFYFSKAVPAQDFARLLAESYQECSLEQTQTLFENTSFFFNRP
jgi:predicted signal transduction protein with EAL and GGDEF domain